MNTGMTKALVTGGNGALGSDMAQVLREAGFDARLPQATMYLWVPVPGGESSVNFAERVLEQEGVIVLPGGALGAGGEGFFRIALTVREERLVEAAERLGRCLA